MMASRAKGLFGSMKMTCQPAFLRPGREGLGDFPVGECRAFILVFHDVNGHGFRDFRFRNQGPMGFSGGYLRFGDGGYQFRIGRNRLEQCGLNAVATRAIIFR